MTAGGPLLVIDTATTHAVVALGAPDGALLDERSWVAGYRHGEELLARIEGLLRDRASSPAALGGIVVGTGPGAFTGLRVGIATAKGLAYALRPADRRGAHRRGAARRRLRGRRRGRPPDGARPAGRPVGPGR